MTVHTHCTVATCVYGGCPVTAVQQVDALRRQRERYLEELKEVSAVRRKEPELQNLKHQIDSLENRLSFSKKDREVTVS